MYFNWSLLLCGFECRLCVAMRRLVIWIVRVLFPGQIFFGKSQHYEATDIQV